MLETLGLLLLGIAMLFLAGFGPTLLLLGREHVYPRVAAIPVVGLASYIVLSHFLANLGLNGVWVSRICPLIFLALLVAVPRDRRVNSKEISESLSILLVCAGALLVAAWPLLLDGHTSFLGFGNPDAAFNLSVFGRAQDHAYRDNLSPVPYWPGPNSGYFFGAGYVCILLASLTGVDILGLHDVVSALLVFIAPSTIFIFSIVCLKASRRTALLAAVASACSSLVCYTFCLQSFGAITLIALLPGVLAVTADALHAAGNRKILLAALLITGTIYGYYAAVPILLVLIGVAAGAAIAQDAKNFTRAWRLAAASAALALATFPSLTLLAFQRSLLESGSSRLVASLDGPELLLSFGFTLTEQYLPFVWGLTIPPFAADTVFEAPALLFFVTLALSLILSVFTLRQLLRKSAIPVAIRIQIGIFIAAMLYFILRQNGYGTFKLAAWFNPVFAAFLVAGAVSDPLLIRKSPWPGRIRNSLFVCMLLLNLTWTVRLGLLSLHNSTSTAQNLAGITASELIELSSLSKVVPADSRILVAIPDAAIQRWVLTAIRRGNLSVVPLLSLSPDTVDGSEQQAALGADSARYVLMLKTNSDITSSSVARPLWENAKFQLLSIDSVKSLLLVGRGWYHSERAGQLGPQWDNSFRGLRSNGELILLNASGDDLRLKLTVVSGVGDPTTTRSLAIALNGVKFDEIDTAGVANVVTKPFRASGLLNHLNISLADSAKPLPRKFSIFRPWVPRDVRRLNILVLKIELLTEKEYEALNLPCRLDFARPQDWHTAGLNGIYSDRWIARQAHVALQACGETDSVSIKGFAPSLSPSPSEGAVPVTVGVDGSERTVNLDKPGPFNISLPLSRTFDRGSRHEISVGTSRTFVPAELGLGPDPRRISINLDSIELQNLHQFEVKPGTGGVSPGKAARSKQVSGARQ